MTVGGAMTTGRVLVYGHFLAGFDVNSEDFVVLGYERPRPSREERAAVLERFETLQAPRVPSSSRPTPEQRAAVLERAASSRVLPRI